jgi:hypothetical protein
VEAVKRAGNPAELALIVLGIEVHGNRVSIRADAPSGPASDPDLGPRVDLQLWVPRNVELANIVSGRGEVTISNTTGGAVAMCVNGSVLVERSAGDLRLKCVNGRTVARLFALENGRCVELETVNGSTTVVLPPAAAVDVSASVLNGNVVSDLGLPVEPDFPAGRKMEGRLGGGGATVRAHTVNGSVAVWKGRDAALEDSR